MEGISILEELKKHFAQINFKLNQSEIQNAVCCVYDIMNDEELLIPLIIRSLYPLTDYMEVLDEFERKEKSKEDAEKSRERFIESSKL